MPQSPDPTRPNPPSAGRGRGDDPPDAALLNAEQWLYLQEHYDLTPRERQIAELICRGLTNSPIADRLKISPGTVKTHLRNIYRKIKVRSKIAMLLTFVAEGRRYNSWDHIQDLL